MALFQLQHDECWIPEDKLLQTFHVPVADISPYLLGSSQSWLTSLDESATGSLSHHIALESEDSSCVTLSWSKDTEECNQQPVNGKSIHVKHKNGSSFTLIAPAELNCTVEDLMIVNADVSNKRNHGGVKKVESGRTVRKNMRTPSFRCEDCGTTFIQKYRYEKHMLRHAQPVIPNVCPTCHKEFPTKSDVRRHMKVHSGARDYACTICRALFTSSSHLKRHTNTVHTTERPHSCSSCGKAFKSKDSLNQHSVVHATGPKKFSCSVCNAAFRNGAKLKQHLLCHSEERPYYCVICEKGFKTNAALGVHMTVHDDTRDFVCQVCKQTFKRYGYLAAHMKNKHSVNRERSHRCSKCEYSFFSPYHLQRHLDTVHNDAEYECAVCGRGFNTEEELRHHEAHHTTDELPRTHSCTKCSRKFVTKHDLLTHSIVHVTARPYVCSLCNKSFKTAYALQLHKQRPIHQQALFLQ